MRLWYYSDTEVRRGEKRDRKRGADKSSSEDEYEQEERQRQADIKERDEYARRVKDRDKEKTRKIMSKSEQKVSDTFFDTKNFGELCSHYLLTYVGWNNSNVF